MRWLGRIATWLVLRLWLFLAFASSVEAEPLDPAIDLFVVYTEDVFRRNGYSADGVEAAVLAHVASANQAFINSKVSLRLRLVGLRRVDYSPSSESLGDDLDALSDRDGIMDEVHEWREEAGADLVCLFRARPVDDAIGMAWILDRAGGDDSSGFSVVVEQYGLSGLVLQHEIGHNLGAAHDRDNANVAGLFEYSYGHRFTAGQTQYRTVMAYDPGASLNYFSNPSIDYEGVPTGVASGASSADNARTLRATAEVTIAYRDHVHVPPQALAGRDVIREVAEGESVSVTLDGSLSESEEGIVRWNWMWAAGSGSEPIVEASFAPGQHAITLTVTDTEEVVASEEVVVDVRAFTPSIKSLWAAERATFITKTNGITWAMGDNLDGKLGIEEEGLALDPAILQMADLVEAAIGYEHSVFLRGDGSVCVVGRGSYGQLGTGRTDAEPYPVRLYAEDVRSIAAGFYHSLFVLDDGSLWATGLGSDGQLGVDSYEDQLAPVEVVESDVVAAAAGGYSSFFIKDDGSLWGMGEFFGGIGGVSQSVPNEIASSGVVAVSAGYRHIVYIDENGAAWALGSNVYGQLGSGPTGQFAGVFTGSGMQLVDSGAVEVIAAGNSTYVRMSDGSLWGCGDNSKGQLGWSSGEHADTLRPLLREQVADVAASGSHTLVLRTDGSVWAAGSGEDGELGRELGDREFVFKRLTPPTMAAVVEMPPVADAGEDALALDGHGVGGWPIMLDGSGSYDDWTIQEWNWTWEGGSASGETVEVEMPVGTTEVVLEVIDDAGQRARDSLSVVVRPYSPAVEVAAGGEYGNCYFVIKRDGSLWGWGSNWEGALGIEGATYVGVPQLVMLDGGAAVSVGGSHTLLVKKDGSLWSAGANEFGQLGLGSTDSSDQFAMVMASGVTAASAGRIHSLALMDDGSLWGMGPGSTLGLVSGTTNTSPVNIAESGVSSALASGLASYVLFEDGSLRAAGSAASSYEFSGLEHVVDEAVAKIVPYGYGIAYQKIDGSLWSLGRGQRGRRGDWVTAPNEPLLLAAEALAAPVAGDSSRLYGIDSEGAVRVLHWPSEFYEASALRVTYGQAKRIAVSSNEGGLILRSDGSVWQLEVELSSASTLQKVMGAAGEPINEAPEATAGMAGAYYTEYGRYRFVADASLTWDDWHIPYWYWTIGSSWIREPGRVKWLEPGVHTINLTVRDHEGLESSDSVKVVVEEAEDFLAYLQARLSPNQLERMSDLYGEDFDGDGLTNELEYRLGTDPSSSRSALKLERRLSDAGELQLALEGNFEKVTLRLLVSEDLVSWRDAIVIRSVSPEGVERVETSCAIGEFLKIEIR